MNKKNIEILKSYMSSNVAPILLFNMCIKYFPTAVVLESNCEFEQLNGHYEGSEFLPPEWYNKLLNNKDFKRILIINNIDKISKFEQDRFIEIIKYKKVSTFQIPENTIIILLASSSIDVISSRINSLVKIVEV